MSIISYGDKAIIPAPFVNITREIVRNEAGQVIRRVYNITVKGKMLYYKGSPNAQGIFWQAGGEPPDLVEEENWSVEAIDDRNWAYRVTHNVVSQQKDLYDATGNIPTGNHGWERARTIVLAQIGIDFTKAWATGVLNLTNWQAYNYMRQQQIDESQGRFAVSETWILLDTDNGSIPPARDEYTVVARESSDHIVRVNIEGSVQGFETRNNATWELIQSRWDAANAYFNNYVYSEIFNRATNISNITLNPIPLNVQINRDTVNGKITYTAEYDNRALPQVVGAIEETIQITEQGGEMVFAEIPIIGRAAGPVLQNIGTIKKKVRSISIEATMPAQTMTNTTVTQPNTDNIVDNLKPLASIVLIDENSIVWIPKRGKYTRTVRYVYQ
jgi:hypothetical protein